MSGSWPTWVIEVRFDRLDFDSAVAAAGKTSATATTVASALHQADFDMWPSRL